MKTINQFIITVGILLCSMAVWADDAKEKAALETYFSWRGTTYQEVIALAEENQALRDSVNTLYKNSFAVIDTVEGEYIFQGFITLDGVVPALPKVDTLYISEEAAAYLGEDGVMTVKITFMSLRGSIIGELKRCLGVEAPKRMLPNTKPADPIFGTLPYRVDGINYALSGGMLCLIQKLMRGDDIEITKCMLNSDVYFKATARLMEAFQTTDLYQQAKAKPLIYDVPLAKAQRLAYLNRDTHDMLYFVGLNGNDTVRLDKFAANAQNLANLTATFEYSKDRMIWKEYTWGEWYADDSKAKGNSIALNQGDTVFFRAKGINGKNGTMSGSNTYFNFVFGADDSIAAGGNIMSLYDASCTQDTMTKYGFYCLFLNAKQLISAPKLPATQLANLCYQNMFIGCTALTTVQDTLPAVKLAIGCYNVMFSGCTALTKAPELPATNLTSSCYKSMFSGCTALTAAPALHATTLASSCYTTMFANCTSLEIDTCSDDAQCKGALLVAPATGATNWNVDMFMGCHEYATTQLGGHYCVKEWAGPHTITFQSVDSTRAYDATPLMADSVMISNPKFDRSLVSFDVTGAQTEVGEGENTFTYVWTKPAKAADYAVDTVFGKLKVDYISTTPVVITIDTLEKKYDGAPLDATYSFTGVAATDSVVLKLDTTTLTDAGIVAVKALDCKIMRGETNVTNGYIVKPVQPGSLEIKPREITITSATDSKLFDMSALTNNKITFSGDGFVGTDTVTVTVLGSQTKVGLSDNTFTYLLAGGAKEQNYTITTQVGTLVVYNPIHPVIEGMYDQWNIVLDQLGLADTLETFINGVTILPENVTWYVVNGEADKANEVTGAVTDDAMASPAYGFYHTEGKAMNGQYYCVVKVPEAEPIMGISYFQSNVVFIQTPAPTTPIRKAIKDGQLIIIRDGDMYNAQGQEL